MTKKITPFFTSTLRLTLVSSFVCASMVAASVPQSKYLVLELDLNTSPDAKTKVLDASGQKADLFGSGITGGSFDKSFDNSGSTGMGGNNQTPGSGGRLEVAEGSKMLAGAQSFTVQGWYKSAAGRTPANYARLLSSARVSCFFDNVDGKGLVVSVNRGQSLCPDGAFRLPGEWVFFAITYDSTKNENNVCFYAGSTRDAVRLVGRDTMDAGRVGDGSSNNPLVVGNVSAGDRPFAGQLDSFRIWADKGGDAAVLSLEDLETVRRSDT